MYETGFPLGGLKTSFGWPLSPAGFKEGQRAQMVLNVSLIKLMNVWEAPEKQMQQKKMKANVIKP